MKKIVLMSSAALMLSAGASFAQSNTGSSVRVQPGHFCALNKCVRFSRDLGSVSIQARQPASVESYGLRSNPVISADEYREIFRRALVQPGLNDNRN